MFRSSSVLRRGLRLRVLSVLVPVGLLGAVLPTGPAARAAAASSDVASVGWDGVTQRESNASDGELRENIDGFNGVLRLNATDLALPGRGGFDFRLERYYESAGYATTSMSYDAPGGMAHYACVDTSCPGANDGRTQEVANAGEGWFMAPAGTLGPFTTEPTSYRASTGERISFQQSSANGDKSVWYYRSPNGWREEMAYSKTDATPASDVPSKVTVTDPDGTGYEFVVRSSSVSNGVRAWMPTAMSAADRDNKIAFTHVFDTTARRWVISMAADSVGRRIVFRHDGPRVTMAFVDENADNVPQASERVVVYSYGASVGTDAAGDDIRPLAATGYGLSADNGTTAAISRWRFAYNTTSGAGKNYLASATGPDGASLAYTYAAASMPEATYATTHSGYSARQLTYKVDKYVLSQRSTASLSLGDGAVPETYTYTYTSTPPDGVLADDVACAPGHEVCQAKATTRVDVASGGYLSYDYALFDYEVGWWNDCLQSHGAQDPQCLIFTDLDRHFWGMAQGDVLNRDLYRQNTYAYTTTTQANVRIDMRTRTDTTTRRGTGTYTVATTYWAGDGSQTQDAAKDDPLMNAPKTVTEAGLGVARTTYAEWWTNPARNIGVPHPAYRKTTIGAQTVGPVETVVYDASAPDGKGGYGLATQRWSNGVKAHAYAYDTDGQLASDTDAEAQTTTYTGYVGGIPTRVQDPAGVVAYQCPNALGEIASVTDGRGASTWSGCAAGALNLFTTTYARDKMGRTVGIAPETGPTTTITYTPYGMSTSSVTTETGATRETRSFDGFGRLRSRSDQAYETTTYTYDSLGRLRTEVDVHGEYAFAGDTRTYDAFGRPETTTHPDQTTIKNEWTDETTLKVTDERQKTSVYRYAAFNASERRPVSVTDPLGTVTSQTYDDRWNLPATVAVGADTQRTWTYDDQGLLQTETSPETAFSYTYYPDNTPKTRTDTRAGTVLTYAYDAHDRPTSIQDTTTGASGPTVATYRYDKAGNRITADSFAYAYDAANRLTAEAANDWGGLRLDLAYDVLGRLASTTYPAKTESARRKVVYQYDERARLTDVAGYIKIRWSDVNTPRVLRYANGRDVVQGVDSRLRTISLADSTADVLGFTYAYGDGLNLTGVTDARPAGAHANRAYTYDPLNRLDTATADGLYTRTYRNYTPTGNRVNVDTGPDPTTGTPLTDTYTYTQGPNLLGAVTHPDQTQDAFTWDSSGRLESRTPSGKPRQYTAFNSLDRLTEVKTCPQGKATCVPALRQTVAAYTYDADGERITKTAAGTTTRYFRDPDGNVLAELDADNNTKREYVYTPGSTETRIAKIEDGATSYYLNDALGNVAGITDQDNKTICRNEFDPEGRQVPTASNPTPCTDTYGWAGAETDPETNLVYLHARYYDPLGARFLSPDPISAAFPNPQNLNHYTYALNNPNTYADPTGLAEEYSVSFPGPDGDVGSVETFNYSEPTAFDEFDAAFYAAVDDDPPDDTEPDDPELEAAKEAFREEVARKNRAEYGPDWDKPEAEKHDPPNLGVIEGGGQATTGRGRLTIVPMVWVPLALTVAAAIVWKAKVVFSPACGPVAPACVVAALAF